MDTRVQRQFPGVHWIWGGGISFVYEVHPRIVVKVPKSGKFEREQFNKELEIYRVFLQNPPCLSIVQCFYFCNSGSFLEYMRGQSLFYRIQHNHTRDQQIMVVTTVEKLEPLPLRKRWMNDLAEGAAFLESLNLAHGDLLPENILLDRNRLKLSDFGCAAKVGTPYEACLAPYGPRVVDLLQNMEFPKLHGDPLIDTVIDKCWHNRYVSVSELAAHTKTLLDERKEAMQNNKSRKESSAVATFVRAIQTPITRTSGENLGSIDQGYLTRESLSKREFCQDLEKRGLLRVLASGEPEQLGFTFEWYRHNLKSWMRGVCYVEVSSIASMPMFQPSSLFINLKSLVSGTFLTDCNSTSHSDQR
ncbi:kinase-like protein [Aspergillus violaceofuscus CBS 115571]|uniref:Kinase-like protein n=1 Tax=Aspergillus violaceofuscus (strain CBS 115571) TaxID=1450538 RepID=A0A2V5IEP7_ASPV1|nr:kinase-like protein [Aspergillus violaceofuscus CBS 115571]